MKTVSEEKTFLSAEWRDLAMLNYDVDPDFLSEFIPDGTELDCWSGKALVSLVGFRFLKTKVCGISIPFHCNFDEVNLRFYVRRRVGSEARRGVVFIKETLPMNHQVKAGESDLSVEYAWRSGVGWNRLRMTSEGTPELPTQGSEEQFVTEHYWGYSKQMDGRTTEYRVAHPCWRVWSGCKASFEGDVTKLYGQELASVLARHPSSAFLAEGSAVTVFRSRRI